MSATNQSTLKNDPKEVTVVPGPAKELFVWKGPSRLFKKRNREYFSTLAAIVFLLIVILFFIKEWLLIGVIIAFTFVSYILATVPPEQVEHKITSKGLVTNGKTYKWEWFTRFWFAEKWEHQILCLETNLAFPRQLQLILKDVAEGSVKKIVEKYVLFEKPKKTMMDKAAAWIEKKVPLES
jgi:hypothetical protein